MRTTILGAGLLCCCLFIIPACAQSPAQLVKNALAADESGADADHAIQLYRQVVAIPTDQRVYAAFAQFRIAQLTLQQGGLTAAALEFGRLAGDYGEYSDLVGVLLAEDRFDVFHSGIGSSGGQAVVQSADGSERYVSPPAYRCGIESRGMGGGLCSPFFGWRRDCPTERSGFRCAGDGLA